MTTATLAEPRARQQFPLRPSGRPKSKPRLVVSKNQLEADLCRRSFYDFFLRFWSVVVPEKLVPNWHIEYLCNELQTVAERVFRRESKEYDLIINVPPGSTKSTVCSVMFPVWCWLRDPVMRTICGSYAEKLSFDLSDKSLAILTSDKFQELFPEVVVTKKTAHRINNSARGFRMATSPSGSTTGMHAHIILLDDIINPKEAVSETIIKSTNDWTDRTISSRMIDRRVSVVILIMQRLHMDDPTGHMLKKRGEIPIRHINLDAELSDAVRPRALRKKYVDGLLDPERLSRVVLNRALVELGPYGYAGQYRQRPDPLTGGMFEIDKITVRPKCAAMKGLVRYWDKAATYEAGKYTAGVLMGKDIDGHFAIVNVIRFRLESNARERIILQTAKTDRREFGSRVLNAMEQEPGSGGKESAQSTVRNLAGYRVFKDLPKGDKMKRADPFSGQVNGGNVYLVAGAWNAAYLAEMQSFGPGAAFMDQIDASSGCFAILTNRKRVGAFGR